jgi:hypothetical protein
MKKRRPIECQDQSSNYFSRMNVRCRIADDCSSGKGYFKKSAALALTKTLPLSVNRPSTDSFPGAPSSINNLLKNPSFRNGIQKGLRYLGEIE